MGRVVVEEARAWGWGKRARAPRKGPHSPRPTAPPDPPTSALAGDGSDGGSREGASPRRRPGDLPPRVPGPSALATRKDPP